MTSLRAALRPVLAAALLLAALAPAAAFEHTSRTVAVEGQPITVQLYRPEGQGPFPLMVIAHGSPRVPEERAGYGAATFARQAEAYARAGFVVAVPIRRGYGGSGAFREGYGTCRAPDYRMAGDATAADLIATAWAARDWPGVDGTRIVLLGHSAGGWGALAAAAAPELPPGVRGVVNFAAGRGSLAAGEVCEADRLVEAVAAYGRSRVPQLWIYSANDRFFGPDLARRLHAAFTAAGGRARFVQAPAYGEDGHLYIRDIAAWRPTVDGFLREIGMPPAADAGGAADEAEDRPPRSPGSSLSQSLGQPLGQSLGRPGGPSPEPSAGASRWIGR